MQAFLLYLHRYHAAGSTPDQTQCHPCCPSAAADGDGWAPLCCWQNHFFPGKTQLAHLASLQPCTTLPGHLLPQCQGTQINLTTGMCLKRFYAWVAAVHSHSLSWLERVSSPSPRLGRSSPDWQALGVQSIAARRFRGQMETENPNKSNLNKKPWFCPGDFPWSVGWGVRLLPRVPPGHAGKSASLFGDVPRAGGTARSEGPWPPKLPRMIRLAVSCRITLGRLPSRSRWLRTPDGTQSLGCLLQGFLRRPPVKNPALPARSVHKESRGVKPGSRSRNKTCVAWLRVPRIPSPCIQAPKSCPALSFCLRLTRSFCGRRRSGLRSVPEEVLSVLVVWSLRYLMARCSCSLFFCGRRKPPRWKQRSRALRHNMS